jgi:hypothetical protein
MSANFEPDRKVVTAITNANPAVVTAAAHGYTTADIVRVNVPLNYGMRLPREEYEITVINANSFSINEDTSEIDAFVVPGGTPLTTAECLPISHETDNIA